MAGFFTLTLDTTGPQIDIYAPLYSDRSSSNTITITSNEPMEDFQEVYILDSQGVRRDTIFTFVSETELTGIIQFSDYPMGIATIYAMVKDEVGNPSNLASKPINVISSHDSLMLRLTLKEKESPVELLNKERLTVMTEKQASVITKEKSSYCNSW